MTWELDSRFARERDAIDRVGALKDLAPNYAARCRMTNSGPLRWAVEMRKVRFA